ncbi:MAG: phosphodiester glycosidase family protein [Bacteroidia bacterium]
MNLAKQRLGVFLFILTLVLGVLYVTHDTASTHRSKPSHSESKPDSLQYYASQLSACLQKISGLNAQLSAKGKSPGQRELFKKHLDSLLVLKSNILKKKSNVISTLSEGHKVLWNNRAYRVFVARAKEHQIATHLMKTDRIQFKGLADLKKHLNTNNKQVLMVTNGGMFTVDNKPVGFFRSSAERRQYPLDTSTTKFNDNFHLYPNGVFFVDSTGHPGVLTTSAFNNSKFYHAAAMATQSGPMLVIDGKIHPKFKQGSQNVKIRSAVGVISGEVAVFVASTQPVSFWDIAEMQLELFGCRNALFLDGVVSLMDVHDMPPPPDRSFGPMISVTQKSK